ncbi:zinc ribbon domain-containing protein [Gemmatimonadota bacterium]
MNRVVPRLCYSGTESMLKFFTNSLDVAYLGVVPFTLGRIFGLPLVPIAPCGHPTETVLMMEEDQDGIGVLKVATVLGSNGHFLAFRWAMTLSRKVMFVDLSPSEHLKALASGYVDAISTWEPHVTFAKKQGAKQVFKAEDLSFEFTDLLCASGKACDEKRGAILAIKRLHEDHLAALAAGSTGRVAGALESLLHIDFEHVDRTYFEAPDTFQHDDGAALRNMCEHAGVFLVESGLAGDAVKSNDLAWYSEGEEKATQDPINWGYSDDIMCAPFYLAQIRDTFGEYDLELELAKDLLDERIARLSGDHYDETQMIRSVLISDPELAIMKTGRILEREVTELFRKTYRTTPPKRLSQTLVALEQGEIIPPLLASSVDWIRRVRNVATHGEGASTHVAQKALYELVDLLEWSERMLPDLQPRCGKCKTPIEEDWRVCPTCTTPVGRQCQSCDMELQADWKICPQCGK